MDEYVLPAALRLNESITLRRIEPFHYAARHSSSLQVTIRNIIVVAGLAAKITHGLSTPTHNDAALIAERSPRSQLDRHRGKGRPWARRSEAGRTHSASQPPAFRHCIVQKSAGARTQIAIPPRPRKPVRLRLRHTVSL